MCDHELRPVLACERGERLRERSDVVPVALGDRPAERANLRSEVAEIVHLGDPGVGLHLVPVDDHRDLAQAPVRRLRERLPELALLQLAVAGENEDPPGAPERTVGEHEAARLGDAHPERAGARHHLRRRNDVGVTGQPVEPPQLMNEVEVDAPQPSEHRVQARNVVAL